MTFREKWMRDHPGEDFESKYTTMCPSLFGYEPVGSSCANPKDEDLPVMCMACWQREMTPCVNIVDVHYNVYFELTDGRKLAVDYISGGACNPSEVEEEIIDGDWFRVRTATALVRVKISEVAIIKIERKGDQ